MTESEQVASFWKGLGLPGLIDVHTHFMPERVLAKVWNYFDSVGPLTGVRWPIAYRTEESLRLDTLRGFGVRRFTSMVYPHKPQMAAWLNAWSAEFASRTPDCLHTATFFPEPGAVDYVARAVEGGARVFKAHLQVGDYDPGDELLDGVWGLLAEAGIPIVTHCGSGPAPGRYTGPGPVGRLLARHPRLRLIVAHMGMPEYGEFLDLADRHPGCAWTPRWPSPCSARRSPYPREQLPRLADLGDRVLFGTDFPNIPYPYAEALRGLADLGLGDAWLRAVCHDNAARMFGV
nr:amidohydrolase family protein [Planobispora longispora]